jgi:hypothetical protein
MTSSDPHYTEETVELVARAILGDEVDTIPGSKWQDWEPEATAMLDALLDAGLLLPPDATETVEYRVTVLQVGRFVECDLFPARHRHNRAEALAARDRAYRWDWTEPRVESRRVFTWPDSPNQPAQLVYGWTPIEETTT